MPFDEQIPEGGGDGGGDDPEKVAKIVQAALIQTQANIELSGVCPLHTRLDVIMAMCMELITNIRLCRKDDSYTGNFDEAAKQGLLDLVKRVMEELDDD
jgi:hypothetical protein